MLTTSRIVEGGGKIDTPNTQAQDQFDFDYKMHGINSLIGSLCTSFIAMAYVVY